MLSWLLNSINKDIRQNLLNISFACEVCNELKTRYTRSDGHREYHLENLSIPFFKVYRFTVHYNSFKATWDEHISCRPLTKCNYGMLSCCTCDIPCNISNTQQSDVVIQFLIGLNEFYSTLRIQLLLTSPLPSLAQVYALLQEESQQDQVLHSIKIFTNNS